MGAQEMTRFGMKEKDMATLAGLIKEVLVEGKNVAEEVARLRADFLPLQFCFNGTEFQEKIAELHRLI
jgi:glycine/serine hydroxymethyltransferase